MDKSTRCFGNKDPLMAEYHDTEWGVPLHDDNELYGLIVLEGAQAGLSWRTVLHRREAYREAFAGFDPAIVAEYTAEKLEDIRENSGVIRNKLKIASAVKNAKAFIEIQRDFGSFDKYLWEYVDETPVMNGFASWKGVPAETELSQKISKDLKKRGFNFVGPTIMYAYMQSVGMVNDHLATCFRYQQIVDEYGS
ncbi:DNA-3-methyladenine glycosylase I [Candidatus Bathyarchaeota archaeon]|nr:MAG: DNA-3-methyladenine glycosylase I [Candidatus Bathyarchaeota archaeon]